jgi:hypothetical protein
LLVDADLPGDLSGFLKLGAPPQTITAVKTFSANPVIAAITNAAATLTLPTVTGTLALLADLASYVTLATIQTISAVKTFTAQVKVQDQLLLTANGSASAVNLGLKNSAGLGLYSDTTNQIGFATNSTNRVNIANAGLIVVTPGAVGTPSILLNTDTTTGWYSSGSNAWGFAVAGVQMFNMSTAGLSANNAQFGSVLLNNSTVLFVDNTTPSKRIGFQSSGSSASTTLTLTAATTANRAITFPDADTTVVGTSETSTISGVKTFSAVQHFNSGLTIGTNGSTLTLTARGSFTTSTVISASGLGTLIDLDVTSFGFASVPYGTATIRTPTSGTLNWDRTIISISGQFTTTTNVRFLGCNLATTSTSGTATVSYTLWQ